MRYANPRCRGKPCNRNASTDTQRSIPTRAGQTSSPRLGEGPLTVNPHARGADQRECLARADSFGQSPLARGRQREIAVCTMTYGSIPTRAGQTLATASTFKPLAVWLKPHPSESAPQRRQPRGRGSPRIMAISPPHPLHCIQLYPGILVGINSKGDWFETASALSPPLE